MVRMSAMDAAFLAMERPGEPRHIGVVTICGPSDELGPLTLAEVRRTVRARIPAVPTARRLVVEVPLGLGRPSWRELSQVDVDAHVRHGELGPGDPTEALCRLVAELHARPLDRARPLWEITVIPLPEGRVALCAKMHVAALDAVTGTEVLTALLDTTKRPDRRDRDAPVPADRDDTGAIARWLGSLPDQARWAAGFPGRVAARAWQNIGEQLPTVRDTVVETVRRTPGLETVARLLPGDGADVDLLDDTSVGRAPRLSLNAPVGPGRQFRFAEIGVDAIAEIRQLAADGTTFNDVVVAVCSGALRRWLEVNGELPTSPLVALIPILVDGANGTGSHIAGVRAAIPTNVADPRQRLARAHQRLLVAKERRSAVPASLLQDMSMFAPPAVAGLAGRMIDALPHRPMVSPTVNVAITNVPGPRQAMYLEGRPLEVTVPVMPVNDLTPLHIGVQSGHGVVGLGVVASANADDLGSLVEAIADEVQQLREAVQPAPRSSTRRRKGST